MVQQTHPIHDEYPEPKGTLTRSLRYYARTPEEQIKINQKGLELIKIWRQEQLNREKNMTQQELEASQINWKVIETMIDENRSRKLFS